MDKIVYIHDHKFIVNNFYYSEGKFTNSVFKRYLTFNCPVVVISRVSKVNNERISLNKIDLLEVSFSPVKGREFFKIFTIYFFNNLFMICNHIKSSKTIIVRLPSFLGLFSLMINFFLRKPYFIELVGDPKEALINAKNNPSIIYKLMVYIFSLMHSFFVKRADGVIYVTQYDLQNKYPSYSLKEYASNVEINIQELNLAKESYKIKNNIFKIGLIGSFNNHYKGIDSAIKAISYLKEKKIEVNLHILGSGNLENVYLDLASQLNLSDKIFFDGSCSGGAEVNQWLDSLDLYIQPSRTEGLPRSLIEAMARGLPAVATNVGGIPELLPTKFLIPKNVPQELANKIELLISSQQLRYEQGKANYNKAKEYDSKVLGQRRAKFWSQAKAIVEKDLK